MIASVEMPRYQSHKKVWALKITDIVESTQGGATLKWADDGYSPSWVPPEYVAKHKPEVGGYYVVYDDGYASFSPAGPFESGYTRL